MLDGRKTIGLIDSGVGGISVLACARRFLPDFDYIYYADTDHVPYGNKSREEILSYVDQAVRFLISKEADAVILACNTATSTAADTMRQLYSLPIIGMEPALKPAVSRYPNGKILVCATQVTITGERLKSLIESTGSNPDLAALPELVTFAENGVFDRQTVCEYLDNTVKEREKFDAVVLGCTHFTYFRDAFRESFPKAEIIDGNMGTVNRLASLMGRRENDLPESARGSVRYFRSGKAVGEEELERLLGYENLMSEYYNGTT